MILGAHLLAAGCLYLIAAGAAGLALAMLVLALGVATAWDRALLRGARAPRILALSGDGGASIELAGGWRGAVASAGGRAGRHWVIVALQGGARRHLLVTGDMLDAESFRRLRLWTLWGKLPRARAAQPTA
jgi:hypothetical protein